VRFVWGEPVTIKSVASINLQPLDQSKFLLNEKGEEENSKPDNIGV
jgi:hypothetical protein